MGPLASMPYKYPRTQIRTEAGAVNTKSLVKNAKLGRCGLQSSLMDVASLRVACIHWLRLAPSVGWLSMFHVLLIGSLGYAAHGQCLF